MSGRPLLAAALAFGGGVGLGAWLPQAPHLWGWAALAALAAWTALLAKGRLAAGSGVGLAVFVLVGVFRCQSDLAPLYGGGDLIEEGDAVVSGRIARPAELRDGEVILQLEEVRLRRGGGTVRSTRPLQIIVAAVAAGPGYELGDLITARGRVRSLRGDRNLGWFPSPVAPRGRRYAARLLVASPAWVRRDGHDPGSGPSALVLRWRAAADRFWKAHPGVAGEIANSLTTGERAGIPAAVQEVFLRSGLTHLLAISGMNVGFLAALVFLLLRRILALWEFLPLRQPVQPLAALLTLPALWFFMLFSGSQIPVGRAVLSSAAGLVAVVLWRRVDPGDACALAALALLVWDPQALFSASFQLSFAAVAALMLVASRVSVALAEGAGRLQRIYNAARSLFVVSLAASAMTAPLVAFHFQQLSLVGPLANLFAVPFTGLVALPAAWLALVVAVLWGPAGELVARFALWSAEMLVAIASWFACPSWAVLRAARPPLLLTLSLLALASALLYRFEPGKRQLRRAALATTLLAAGWWWIEAHRHELRLAIFDVGQGAAAVALLPGGGSLLVDAGPRWRDYDAGRRVVAPALRGLGVRSLDIVAITHDHPDHAGGLAAIREEFAVGGLWRAGGPGGLIRGAARRLPGGVPVRVLNPSARDRLDSGRPGGNENDESLALLLEWGETAVVFTGDAGPAPAVGLAAAAGCPSAHTLLLAPHHGGSPEACRTLAAALRPEVSVISVGRNLYGHPRPGAVAALETCGLVLRTDREGAIFMRSDGHRFEVRTWRALASGRTWTERLRWLVAGW